MVVVGIEGKNKMKYSITLSTGKQILIDAKSDKEVYEYIYGNNLAENEIAYYVSNETANRAMDKWVEDNLEILLKKSDELDKIYLPDAEQDGFGGYDTEFDKWLVSEVANTFKYSNQISSWEQMLDVISSIRTVLNGGDNGGNFVF